MPTGQQTLRDYLPVARSSTLDAFEKRHPFPFLLGKEVLEEEFSFATAIARKDDPQLAEEQSALRIRDWVLPMRKPGATGKSVRLFVGRGSSNDIAIPHPTVSKLHAYLTHEEGKWWLIDVGSSNGTTVNGIPAPARAKMGLVDKDTLVFGRCAFSYLTAKSLYSLLTRMAKAMDQKGEW